jgi:hypothetical protein
MAQPGLSAQRFRGSEMLNRRPLSGRILTILRVFLVPCLVGGAASAGACSAGESGLVLGKPLPQQAGGQGAVGGSPVAGNASAGTSVVPSEGGEGGATSGGAAGAPGVEDPPWLIDACTPGIIFDNQDTTSKGQLFTNAVPSAAQLLWRAAHNTCRTLYRAESEVKPIEEITLIVYDYAGIASTQGTTIRLSTNHLQETYDRGDDVALEIAGVLHFTTSLVYQNNLNNTAPGWVVTGIADFVRLRAGYIDPAERAKGGAYDGPYSQTTAFFFDYLTTRNPDIVYQLNQRLLPGASAWSDDAFVTFMGSDLDTLWAEYQASFP